MAGEGRGTGTPYRRALVALTAVLVVGGASLTSPTILSSHSRTPVDATLPTVAAPTATPSATPLPTSYPSPTVQGTEDTAPDDPASGVPTATVLPPSPTATMTSRPKITVKRVSVRFATITKKDPQLAKGKTKVLRAGVAGINELTYTDAKLTRTKVIKKPVAKLVAVGTRTAKPWISAQQCIPERKAPVVRVTVSDPDKMGYRLRIVWGKNERNYQDSGTKSFEFRGDWRKTFWWRDNCQVTLG